MKIYLAESSVCIINPGDKSLTTVSSDVILILNCSSEIRGVQFDFVEWSINGKPIGKESRVEQNSRRTWSALFLTNVTSDRDNFQCKLTKGNYRSICDVTPGKQRQILVSFILRWFPQNVRAIMAKIKLHKKTLSMVIVWIKVRRSYRDLSSQADPARENWTWSYPYFS